MNAGVYLAPIDRYQKCQDRTCNGTKVIGAWTSVSHQSFDKIDLEVNRRVRGRGATTRSETLCPATVTLPADRFFPCMCRQYRIRHYLETIETLSRRSSISGSFFLSSTLGEAKLKAFFTLSRTLWLVV